MDPRQLREATRTEHEATEALMPLTGEGVTREIYVQTLEILRPLLGSWESWAERNAPEALQPLLAARRREHLLRDDLAILGGEPSKALVEKVDWHAVVGGGPEVGEAEFHARFVGVLYVLEGSTLGGRYIARHVETVLGFAPGRGDAYFQGHGEATGAMWREITEEIHSVPEHLAPVVIEAARRCFGAFGRALLDLKTRQEPGMADAPAAAGIV